MLSMYQWLVNALHKDEEGQGMVEYALIIVLVAIAVITALMLVGDNVNTVFNSISGSLTNNIP